MKTNRILVYSFLLSLCLIGAAPCQVVYEQVVYDENGNPGMLSEAYPASPKTKVPVPEAIVHSYRMPDDGSFQPQLEIQVPVSKVATAPVIVTNYETVKFWVEWRRETNSKPTCVLEHFNPPTYTPQYNTFGPGIIPVESGFTYSDRPNAGIIIQYVESNLVAITEYKGKTNVNCLESITITNIVRSWHMEKVYDK